MDERDKKPKPRRKGGQPELPPFPTHFMPGTEGKIEVMAGRVKKRLQLYHPLDARLPEKKPRGDE